MEVKHTPGPPADLRTVLDEARGYVAEAVGGYEHSEGRSLLARIDALLSSEAPPVGSEPPCDEGNLPPAEQITQPSHDDEGLPSREQINEVVRTLRDENDTCLRWKETTADWLVRFERNRSDAANTISRLKGELEGLSSARASRDARSSTRPEGQSADGGEG